MRPVGIGTRERWLEIPISHPGSCFLPSFPSHLLFGPLWGGNEYCLDSSIITAGKQLTQQLMCLLLDRWTKSGPEGSRINPNQVTAWCQPWWKPHPLTLQPCSCAHLTSIIHCWLCRALLQCWQYSNEQTDKNTAAVRPIIDKKVR
jgi:hypothetical protein